jgi:hypothetical protein
MNWDSLKYNNINFIFQIGDGKLGEILINKEISNLIDEKEYPYENNTKWNFSNNIKHQGLFSTNHHNYKLSAYNDLVC